MGLAGDKRVELALNMCNRHGLIAGASGTGKTITMKVMADEDFRKALGESFIEIADTDEGREIISVFSQVGYTWGQDSDYDGERAAQELLKSLEG